MSTTTQTKTATALYAVYTGPGGPISVRLEAGDLDAAIAEIEAHGQGWYDDARTDLEDALDATWADGLGSASSRQVEADINRAGGDRIHRARSDRDYDVWRVPVTEPTADDVTAAWHRYEELSARADQARGGHDVMSLDEGHRTSYLRLAEDRGAARRRAQDLTDRYHGTEDSDR